MKPRPHSIRHRFILLQVVTSILAVWFLAGAIYANLRIRHDMEESLRDLHAALALNSEIEVVQGELLKAADKAYFHPGRQTNQEFQAAAGKLPGLAERYMSIRLSAEERREMETVQQLQAHLIEYASQHIGTEQKKPEAVQEVRRINGEIELAMHNIAQAHLQKLEIETAKFHEYTRWLYLLLTGLGLFALLALQQFRSVNKLEATDKELAQAAKLSSLSQLVSGMAHEINNPLTTILGFSELVLGRPDLDPRLRAQLQTIREESVRLKKLVASLSIAAESVEGQGSTMRISLPPR